MVLEEGEPVAEDSIIALPVNVDRPVPPRYKKRRDDPFLLQTHASGMKWVTLVDQDGAPQLVLRADNFPRDFMFSSGPVEFCQRCQRPLIIREPNTPLGT